MPFNTSKLRIWALLLGLVFLAGQFHFCADLNAVGANTHSCPFCATTGSAIATHIPTIGLAPAMVRMEFPATYALISPEVAPSISPRAPPSL